MPRGGAQKGTLGYEPNLAEYNTKYVEIIIKADEWHMQTKAIGAFLFCIDSWATASQVHKHANEQRQ